MNNLLLFANLLIFFSTVLFTSVSLLGTKKRYLNKVMFYLSIVFFVTGIVTVYLFIYEYVKFLILLFNISLTYFILWTVFLGKKAIFNVSILLLILTIVFYLMGIPNLFNIFFESFSVFALLGIAVFTLFEKVKVK